LRNLGLSALILASGGVVMALELSASRLLAPIFGNTIYVWGSLIGVVLSALAIGYWAGGRLADRYADIRLLAAICFTGGLLVFSIPFFSPLILEMVVGLRLNEQASPLIATLLTVAPPSIPLGMVSPYAVKLLSLVRSRVGSSAGDVYSLSTVGSIAGTFLTVFLLLPYLDVRTVILGSGGVLMALSAYYLSLRVKVLTVLVLAMVASPVGFFAQSLSAVGGDVIYTRETLYNSLAVVKQDDVLTLYLNGLPHSSMSTKDPYRLVYAYTRFFELGPALNPNASNVLFIGGGGFSGPKYFLKNYPNMWVHVVELDPAVVEVAERFFQVPKNDRLKVFINDGRMHLQNTDHVYDVVVVDAYAKTYIPFHLLTKEFYSLMRSKMSVNGVVVVNIIASLTGDTSEILWSAYKTVGSVFKTLYLFKASEYGGGVVQNLILVGCVNTCSLDEGVARVKDSWLAGKVLENLWENIPPLDEYPLLTDGYAPVERMINPVTGKPYSLELEDYRTSPPTLLYTGSNSLSLTVVLLALVAWFFLFLGRNI